MSVFSLNSRLSHEPMFFGNELNIARYDIQTHPIFEKLTEQQLSFFWQPNEIDLTKDSRDYKQLSEHEKFIFTENIKYQIALDSVQGRSPVLAYLPFVSLPELEVCILCWSFFESIHSRSYTHIIRNIFSNPSEVFDTITSNNMILDRAKSITEQYDSFIEYSNYYKLLGFGEHVVNDNNITITKYELYKKLYLTLISTYILEGIRFYVSFACSFAFAELGKMEGNSKIISLIARDESKHLAIVINQLKLLPNDESIVAQVIADCEQDVYKLFDSAVEQEKCWANHLFKDGSMIGLNASLLCDYISHIAGKRMKSIGLKNVYGIPNNPLSWTTKYLNSRDNQVSPQETEITSYLVGAIDSNISDNAFDNFSL